MKSRDFSHPARHSAKKWVFLILLIAAVAVAGFFLRKKPYEYPYLWSETSAETMTFENSEKYCENLEEKGFSDWRLPKLSEIKSVAELCIEEENPDFCTVTDSCEWDDCENELCGKCLKYKENFDFGSFWTKSEAFGNRVSVFTISEETTEEIHALKNEKHFAKCIRIK